MAFEVECSAGKTVQLASKQVPERMAGEQVKRQQHNVDDKYERADTDTEMALLVGTHEPECPESVIPKEAQKHDGRVEKIAMEVLQDKWEFCFSTIVPVRTLTHRARRWIHEERAVVSLAIVVTSHAEAKREGQN